MTERPTTHRLARLRKAAGSLCVVPVICFAVAMIDGYDTLMMSFVAPLISKEWALAPQTFGKIFAGTYAGAALGAALIGIAADRFGRKPMLIASLLLAGICTCASAGSGGPAALMLWRAAAGIGLGGAIPIISALAAMGAPLQKRRSAVTRVFIGYPIGAMIGGVATAAIMTIVGWRGVLLGGGALTLTIGLLGIWGIPNDTSEPVSEGTNLRSKQPLVELVAEGRARRTILICLSAFLILLVSYFLLSWMPIVLSLNGVDPRIAAMSGVLLNIGGLVGAWGLSTILGRRNPPRAVALCLAAGSVLIAWLGLGMTGAGPTALVLMASIGILIIGSQINVPALCAHLYPVHLCATGVGLAMAVGRLGSIVGPLAGGYLVAAHLGWNRLFLLAALPALLAALGIYALSPRQPDSAIGESVWDRSHG